MGDGRIYDGSTVMFGQNTADDPSTLRPDVAAKAVNRVFRGGRNRTRPPFVHGAFIFDVDTGADQYEDVVRFGNYQGHFEYKKKKPGREDGFVISLAGHIFFLTLVNEKWFVRFVTKGNDARLLFTWFTQAEEWCYIQNGLDPPIFWNGLFPSTARRSNPTENEMPIGTIMAYGHGRVFLSNAFNQVAASDIIYGNGLTRSNATQMFTENIYWAEGGYFGMPTELDEITGMIVVSRQDQLNNGQGEVLVMGRDGAYSIEASIPRSQWKSQRMQQVTLTGRGNEAPGSLINVNNDVFMRSDDGLSSYSLSRSEQKTKLSFGKLSRHVNLWMDQDTEWMRKFCSSIYFDNRVLTTVSPFLGASKGEAYGNHRYHRGIVALDLDQASDVQGDSSFNWDGLWTGIRPCGLMKLRKRAFAWSYDADGENRMYELRRNGIHDQIDGKAVQTKWFYLSKRYDWKDSQRSNSFEIKRLVGGQVWISDIRDRIKIAVDYRSDNSPCWHYAMEQREFGSDFGNEWLFSLPRYSRLKFGNPEEVCDPAAPYPSTHGSQMQIMVKGEGAVQVDRMRIGVAAFNDPDSPDECVEDDPKKSLDCRIENDYSYEISDSR